MGLTLTLTWDRLSSGEHGTSWSPVLPGTPPQTNAAKASNIFRNAQEWGTEAQAGNDGPLKPFLLYLLHLPLPTYVEGLKKGSLLQNTMWE